MLRRRGSQFVELLDQIREGRLRVPPSFPDERPQEVQRAQERMKVRARGTYYVPFGEPTGYERYGLHEVAFLLLMNATFPKNHGGMKEEARRLLGLLLGAECLESLVDAKREPDLNGYHVVIELVPCLSYWRGSMAAAVKEELNRRVYVYEQRFGVLDAHQTHRGRISLW